MSDLRTRILIDLGGNLEQRAQRYSGVLDRFSKTGQRSLGGLSRSAQAASNGLDRIGNRYTAVLTGAAGLGAIKMAAEHHARMTQLGVDASISAEAVEKLNQKIFETARQPDIRIDPTELLTAVEEIVKATGDLPFAERNLRNLGLVMRATAATGSDVGAMVTELQKLDKAASPENIMLALDVFNVQGKAGAVALRDLAHVGPRVFAAYASMRKGADPATFVRELGAALQTIKGGTGNVEQAATSFEALMRVFSDKKRIEMFKKAGIQVFDPKALKAHREELRPINELMAEIIAKTKGRVTLLDKLIPDAEAKRALTVSNLTENLRNYYQVEADGSVTTGDAARNAKELTAALTSLHTSWTKFANNNLTGPITTLADTLNSLDQETVDRWLKLGTGLALSLGGLVIANQAIKFGKETFGLGRWILTGGKGGKEGAGGLGGAAGGFGDAVPVYVVNGPSSIWPGSGGGPAGSTAAAVASRFAWAGPLIPIVGTAIAVEASQAAGKALARAEAQGSSSKKLLALRGRQMVMGGGPDSFQVRTIDQELTRRLYGKTLTPSHSQEQPLRGEVVVKVRAERGTEARTDMVRSSHGRGLDLQAETEVGSVGRGVF